MTLRILHGTRSTPISVVRLGEGLYVTEGADGTHELTTTPTAYGDQTPGGGAVQEVTDGESFDTSDGDSDVVIEAVPSALTVVPGWLRRRVLTGFSECRIEALVTEALPGAKLALVVSADGGVTWDYADGAAGPFISLSSVTTVPNVSAFSDILAGYRTDLLIGIAAVGGDGASSVVVRDVRYELSAHGTAPPPGDVPFSLTNFAWLFEAEKLVAVDGSNFITAWENQIVGGLDWSPEASPLLDTQDGLLSAKLFSGSRFRFPSGSFDGRSAGHLFQLIKCSAASNPASSAGHGDWTGAGNAFLSWVSGNQHLFDYGTAALKSYSPADALSLTVWHLLEIEWDASTFIFRHNGVEKINTSNSFSGFNSTPIVGPANFAAGNQSSYWMNTYGESLVRLGASVAADVRAYLLGKVP